MSSIVLSGLDGTDPLGFMAALGALEATSRTIPSVRLAWRQEGNWRPVLTGIGTAEELVSLLTADLGSDPVERALGFRYVKSEKLGPKLTGALMPPASVLRAWLRKQLADDALDAAGIGAALMCETATEAVDPKRGVPASVLEAFGVRYDDDYPLDRAVSMTPFDFTSRNTQFLDQLDHIRRVLTAESMLSELLEGGGAPCDRNMGWDPLLDLPRALFPGARPSARPTAEWLMFRALPLFTLVGDQTHVSMPSFRGRRKSGELSWGLWDGELPRQMVQTLLTMPIAGMSPEARQARGIRAVFRAAMLKDATGYAGVFSPSAPV